MTPLLTLLIVLAAPDPALEALAAFRAGDHARAAELWTALAGARPGDARVRSDLSLALHKLGRYHECVETARSCQVVGPPEVAGACAFNEGLCLRDAGHREAAIAALERSLALRPVPSAREALAALQGAPAGPDWQSAARAWLAPRCKGVPQPRGPGNLECERFMVQGLYGRFTGGPADEALLIVSDLEVPRLSGSGYGVLMRRGDAGWGEVQRYEEIYPADGLWELARFTTAEGRTLPVLCGQLCPGGCCSGDCSLYRLDEEGARPQWLFNIGGNLAGVDVTFHNATPGEARVRDLDGDGVPDLEVQVHLEEGTADDEGNEHIKARRSIGGRWRFDGRQLAPLVPLPAYDIKC